MAEGSEPEDYREIFLELTKAGLPYFVEGGQAVNFWAQIFEEAEPKLKAYLPYSSKDCDLWIGHRTFAAIKKGEVLDGTLKAGDSPIDGQLGIFTTNDLPVKIIDLMQGVYGIAPDRIDHAYSRSLDLNGVRVLDPLLLLKGKCHNYAKLDQSGRQDEKHLNMLVLILPVYFRYLLHETRQGVITERAFIKEVKFLRQFAKDSWVRRVLSERSTDLENLIPVAELTCCGLERIERFASETWKSGDKAT